jgi:pimeloyl-ACP methyl ester carboxylesterase
MEPSESDYLKQLFIKEATFAHFFSVMARIRLVSKLNMVEKLRSSFLQSNISTLIIFGDDDHFTKRASIELQGVIPHCSKLASLPGGHLTHVSHPREFAKLVYDFIVGV